MRIKIIKVIISIVIICLGMLILDTKVYAASIGISASKSAVSEGETFTVTVSGINGYIDISCNSNISVSPSGKVWVDDSKTITVTAKSAGTGTVTVSPISVSSIGAEPQKITAATSKSVTIIAKATPTPSPTSKPTVKATKKPVATPKATSKPENTPAPTSTIEAPIESPNENIIISEDIDETNTIMLEIAEELESTPSPISEENSSNSTFLDKYWAVVVVAICSILQSSIAIYFVLKSYRKINH